MEMNCKFTPATCHINLGALKRNFKKLGQLGSFMPVIKSDAYGHGLLKVAKALADCGAVRFAVGTVSEGQTLRQNGFTQAIIPLLGCLDNEDWASSLRYKLTPLISNFPDLQKFLEFAGHPSSTSQEIAIKCDTGMSRLGFSLAEIPQLMEILAGHAFIRPVMLLSHLACADMPAQYEFTRSQISTFSSIYKSLSSIYPDIAPSLGNSAATLALPEGHFEILRPGISLYGGNPFAGLPTQPTPIDLEWVMSVSAPILQIRMLEPGQSVSYGRIFTASRKMKIGVIAIGYASGYNRRLSNNFELLINGQRCSQIGRVCMGMLMVDLSHVRNVKPGDRAWILGGVPRLPETAPTAQEMADKLETIPYEILCLFGNLIPRIYEDD